MIEKMEKIQIGNLRLPSGAALAPMAGVTDHVMRLLCNEYGAAWSVTEMINAQGYCCAPENAAAIERLLYHTPEEGVIGVQLFGREPEYFGRAAAAMEQRGFAFIDINMGCPARKVVSGGDGSGYQYGIKEPQKSGHNITTDHISQGVCQGNTRNQQHNVADDDLIYIVAKSCP